MENPIIKKHCACCKILIEEGELCSECQLIKESFNENDNVCWICGGEIEGFNIWHYITYGRQHKHCRYEKK